MSLAEAVPEAKHRSILSRIVPDKRQHRRVPMALVGRFMNEEREEHHCRLKDISVGGAAIESAQVVAEGERIIAYFDEIGRLDGVVVRRFDGGFAIKCNMPQHKREKLAATLTWLLNRDLLHPSDKRRHARIVPRVREAIIHLDDNAILECKLLDVSLGGASIASEARPAIGTDVKLGQLRARVVRHHDQGFGLEFVDIQNPNALKRALTID